MVIQMLSEDIFTVDMQTIMLANKYNFSFVCFCCVSCGQCCLCLWIVHTAGFL